MYIYECHRVSLVTLNIWVSMLVYFNDSQLYSVRHLWRLRKKYDVHTRQNESDLNEIVDAIQNELNQSGSLLGYRLMWVRLRIKYNLNVRRDTVMMLLNLMDPNGSNLRKSKKLQRRIYRSKVCWLCNINLSLLMFLKLGTKLFVAYRWISQVETLWNYDSWLYWWVYVPCIHSIKIWLMMFIV